MEWIGINSNNLKDVFVKKELFEILRDAAEILDAEYVLAQDFNTEFYQTSQR